MHGLLAENYQHFCCSLYHKDQTQILSCDHLTLTTIVVMVMELAAVIWQKYDWPCMLSFASLDSAAESSSWFRNWSIAKTRWLFSPAIAAPAPQANRKHDKRWISDSFKVKVRQDNTNSFLVLHPYQLSISTVMNTGCLFHFTLCSFPIYMWSFPSESGMLQWWVWTLADTYDPVVYMIFLLFIRHFKLNTSGNCVSCKEVLYCSWSSDYTATGC